MTLEMKQYPRWQNELYQKPLSLGRVKEITKYDGQECTDNLQYEVVQDGTKENITAGVRKNMTIAAFASWAKSME